MRHLLVTVNDSVLSLPLPFHFMTVVHRLGYSSPATISAGWFDFTELGQAYRTAFSFSRRATEEQKTAIL